MASACAGMLEQILGMLHTELDTQVLGNCLAVMIEVSARCFCSCQLMKTGFVLNGKRKSISEPV